MADSPYVYASSGLRPVEAGGMRVRVFRRRPRPEEDRGENRSARDEESWGLLLREAASELNEALRRAGSPSTCVLEEDDGFVLRVLRTDGGEEGSQEVVVDEVLDPADLPAWLLRLRIRLGLLVDEVA